jgi:hypothetical protein
MTMVLDRYPVTWCENKYDDDDTKAIIFTSA